MGGIGRGMMATERPGHTTAAVEYLDATRASAANSPTARHVRSARVSSLSEMSFDAASDDDGAGAVVVATVRSGRGEGWERA